MKNFFLIFFLFSVAASAAQRFRSHDTTQLKQTIDSINRLIDRAVVNKRITTLEKHYAADFVFTHGTGKVDSKASWLKNVRDTATHFLSREHDSVYVEPHGDLAIAVGTLTVRRQGREAILFYALRYVRVYAYREKRWQLLSHRTTAEWHLN